MGYSQRGNGAQWNDEKTKILHPDSGNCLAVGLRNKTVWYRLRQHSGGAIVDAMGNGPDIPLLDKNGLVPDVWANPKWATPPDDGSGQASTYARVIGNQYFADLFSLQKLEQSKGLLFFAGDIFPVRSPPSPTQTILQIGGGSGPTSSNQSIAFGFHVVSGYARLRFSDGGVSNCYGTAESVTPLIVGQRNALCGFIDMNARNVGVSLNGVDFVVTPFSGSAPGAPIWNDSEMMSKGVISMAQNPTTTGAVPINFMGGSLLDIGTRVGGIFVTRFDSHPGLDIAYQLMTEFYESSGAFPDDLRTGKY